MKDWLHGAAIRENRKYFVFDMKFNSWSPKQALSKSTMSSKRSDDATGKHPRAADSATSAGNAKKTFQEPKPITRDQLNALTQASEMSLHTDEFATRDRFNQILAKANLPTGFATEIADNISSHLKTKDVTPTFFESLPAHDKEAFTQKLATQAGLSQKPKNKSWSAYMQMLSGAKNRPQFARDQLIYRLAEAKALKSTYNGLYNHLRAFSQDDEMMRLAAIGHGPEAFYTASEAVRDSPIFYTTLVQKFPEFIFRYADKVGISEEDLQIAFQRTTPSIELFFAAAVFVRPSTNGVLLDDVDFMRNVLSGNSNWLTYAGPSVVADATAWLAAANSHPYAGVYLRADLLPNNLSDDAAFLRAMMPRAPQVVSAASPRLAADPAFWQSIAAVNPGAFRSAAWDAPQTRAALLTTLTQEPGLLAAVWRETPHMRENTMPHLLAVPGLAQELLALRASIKTKFAPHELAEAVRLGTVTRKEALAAVKVSDRVRALLGKNIFSV